MSRKRPCQTSHDTLDSPSRVILYDDSEPRLVERGAVDGVMLGAGGGMGADDVAAVADPVMIAEEEEQLK